MCKKKKNLSLILYQHEPPFSEIILISNKRVAYIFSVVNVSNFLGKIFKKKIQYSNPLQDCLKSQLLINVYINSIGFF